MILFIFCGNTLINYFKFQIWNKNKDFIHFFRFKIKKTSLMQTQKNAKSIKEYDQKEFAPCDIKLILLGDSAVGKSKYLTFQKFIKKYIVISNEG